MIKRKLPIKNIVLIVMIGLMMIILMTAAGCRAKSGNSDSAESNPNVTIGPSVGNFAPKFELSGPDGKKISLESLRGKPVFLNFWATWCYPCRSEMPDLYDMYLKYDGQMQFLTINVQESANTVSKFMHENKYTFPVVLDKNGAVSNKYRVTGIPTTVILDAEGFVKVNHVGAMNASQMEAYILEVLE